MTIPESGQSGGGFFEVAAILSIATLIGILGLRLKQPLIIMLLLTGILAGPACFGIIENYTQIEIFAQIGIALLLFIVGLRLDLNLIRTTGLVALVTGFTQIALTAGSGFLLATWLGFDWINSAYISVALSFSSTIIIVKLLSDKKEIDSLHGRIAVGVLIIQDIVAIIAMISLASMARPVGADETLLQVIAQMASTAIGLLMVVALLMRYVLPPFLRSFARSQELLVLFAIAWAVFAGAVCEWIGFSKEVGAFLAGVSLASTDYRDAISARLVSLRDFLLLFFFVDLGARLDWSAAESQFQNALLLSFLVLLAKPLAILVTMGAMGYRRRTAFLAGSSLAQISEFSLIVAALGFSLGHISSETMGLITLVGVITIFVSTYLILYSSFFYRLLATPLKIFERANPKREAERDTEDQMPTLDVIIVGLGNYGSELATNLLERKRRCIGVDFNPQVLDTWRAKGLKVLYGDMGDPEIHEQLPLESANWIVSTVRDVSVNIPLFRLLKQGRYSGKIALSANSNSEATIYKAAGADVILRPYRDAAEQAADSLTEAMHVLRKDIDWPVAFREIRLKASSMYSGKAIREVPLRSVAGVSIIAISRAGRVIFNPEPDTQLFPGDRVVIMGPTDELFKAEKLLLEPADYAYDEESNTFAIGEITIRETSTWVGKTLSGLQLRPLWGVTVIGIQRGEEKISNPNPEDILQPNDHIILIGTRESVEKLKHLG